MSFGDWVGITRWLGGLGIKFILNNSHVDAGNKLTIASGTDTTLSGAVVSGKQVVMDVGTSGQGNLNIASLPDTSTYKSKQQSLGGSISVGMGKMNGSISASRSSVDGNYASVIEQSGIRTGDDGFQINVAGNTDLKGARIASTDKAVADGKNSLTTQTLTQSEIQNRSDYKAESQSVSIGGAGGKPTGGIGIGSASGSESSVTRSGVSGGAVTITDAQAQQAKTGQSADQVVASLDSSVRTDKDSSNSLKKNWDGEQLRDDVEAQAKITQAFGQRASKLIGDYAEEQTKKAAALRTQADAATDPAVAKELNDQAAAIERNWGPDGTARVLAHTVVGGLTGGLAGAAGAAAGTLTAPTVASALGKAGVDADLAKVLTGLSSTLVGTAVGGGAGGAAAYNEVVNNFLGHIDRERLNKLRQKAQSKEKLTDDEAKQLVFLEVSDQISDGLLNKYRAGQPLTKFEQQNLAIYLGGYSQQNGEEATRQLVQNGSAPAYTFPYAGSSSDRLAYTSKNFTWLDYWYRNNQSTNELIFNDARAQAGIYPNVTPYESLTPVGLQLSRFFSVLDSITNSSLAAGTYLGATALGASAETRDGLTIAMGQLAQIGAAFMLPRAGISPVFGETTASAQSATGSASIGSTNSTRDQYVGDSRSGNVNSPSGGGANSALGKVVGNYSAINPGPLADNLAGTFAGGKYTTVTLQNDTILYRAGTADQPLGQFFSTEPPTGVLQTRIDKAVLPKWPGGGTSPIDTSFAIKIPAGTQVHIGEVGTQTGFYVGGTQQVVVLKPWTIPGVQVINSNPLK
eukprot:TRINITY_DN1243_c0_g1_i1.p1 TRINITY_DN1243_c0_g1~~TRINITY_DN1243_c0_g1_i1.p1  ORF type:complete len:800 (+),score=126.78 TRINITY_DN1243_c0_g1_i1:840-3239(+)